MFIQISNNAQTTTNAICIILIETKKKIKKHYENLKKKTYILRIVFFDLNTFTNIFHYIFQNHKIKKNKIKNNKTY